MKLKKINAILGLLSILFILLHIGYNVFAYLTFFYDPVLKTVFTAPLMIAVMLHAVCGMLTVFLLNDGTRLDMYPKQNLGTILQRVSAALIFPLLIIHMKTFSVMQASAEAGRTGVILIMIVLEILFFAVILTHVAISFSKGLITLGFLSSPDKAKKTDRVVYVLGAIVFCISVFAVVKTQVAMFLLR